MESALVLSVWKSIIKISRQRTSQLCWPWQSLQDYQSGGRSLGYYRSLHHRLIAGSEDGVEQKLTGRLHFTSVPSSTLMLQPGVLGRCCCQGPGGSFRCSKTKILHSWKHPDRNMNSAKASAKWEKKDYPVLFSFSNRSAKFSCLCEFSSKILR